MNQRYPQSRHTPHGGSEKPTQRKVFFSQFFSKVHARHTGIVCENMQDLGAKLRKLPGQAKICTPPGGDACVVSTVDMSGQHVGTGPDMSPDMTGHGGHRGTLHAKICSGDLSGSGLRKYALRQNHTIPVWWVVAFLTATEMFIFTTSFPVTPHTQPQPPPAWVHHSYRLHGEGRVLIWPSQPSRRS